MSDVDYIGICRTGVVVALYNSTWYQVMTPEGFLNHKKEMIIDGDFGKISIDHVQPIDRTLSSLHLPAIDVISRFVKAYKSLDLNNLKGKQLEHAAFSEFCKLTTMRPKNVLSVKSLANSSFKGGKIDINQLRTDLNDVLNDSHYRLMSSSINSGKSNWLTYTEYYVDSTGNKYYGYIGECKINSSTDGVIYQDLDTDYPNVIDITNWNTLKGDQISAVDIPIDKL